MTPIKLTPSQARRLDRNIQKNKDKTMLQDDHRERHARLHNNLQELLRDFIHHKGRRPKSVAELENWSRAQTRNPTEDEPVRCDGGMKP